MLCLCDYILNILYSLFKLLTKLSEYPKSECVRKTYSCFQHHTPITSKDTIHYTTVINIICQIRKCETPYREKSRHLYSGVRNQRTIYSNWYQWRKNTSDDIQINVKQDQGQQPHTLFGVFRPTQDGPNIFECMSPQIHHRQGPGQVYASTHEIDALGRSSYDEAQWIGGGKVKANDFHS